jgi:serine/threonine-protein kinase
MELPEPNANELCPSEHEILALVRGELAPDRLERLLVHTNLCANCALVIAEAGLAVTAETGVAPEHAQRSSGGGTFARGQLIASRYRIQERIGRGGMGEVYAAVDEELAEQVALKTIASALASDPVLVEHFKQELRLARKVSHANVCRTLEFGRHELESGKSQCFFTMQFIDGMTLRRRLTQGEPFELHEALATVRDLALGLEAIHEQNIVHRDIKPDNVMLTPDSKQRAPIPLWLDFGVARVDLRESTARGLLAGTPDYAAPELLAGKVATRASDVYALGLVLHEVLVGDLPFARVASFSEAAFRPSLGPTAPSVLRAGIPAALDELVLECLSVSPERRPTSALLVADRLRTIQLALEDDSHSARVPGVPGGLAEPARARREPRRRPAFLLATAVVAGALGAHLALRPAAPMPPVSVRVEPTASSLPRPSPAQAPQAEENAAPPTPARSSVSRPARTERAKATPSNASQSPISTPSASPHTVSDFGGRR